MLELAVQHFSVSLAQEEGTILHHSLIEAYQAEASTLSTDARDVLSALKELSQCVNALTTRGYLGFTIQGYSHNYTRDGVRITS